MAEALPRRAWGVVVALGVTQIIAWGSLYYAFSLLIQPLTAAVSADPTTVVGAFSVALLLTGVASVPVASMKCCRCCARSAARR